MFARKHVFIATLLIATISGCASQSTTSPEVTSQALLSKVDTTILGDKFSYPVTESPEITSSVITIPPGMETGWHEHEAPLYAYILEGTLEVTYKQLDGTEKTNTYNTGEAIMEALQTPHNGKNSTKSDVKILVVNIGSPELENTIKLP